MKVNGRHQMYRNKTIESYLMPALRMAHSFNAAMHDAQQYNAAAATALQSQLMA
jgi:hypothetical protein